MILSVEETTKLYQENTGLISKILWNYNIRKSDDRYEDLYQECSLGLLIGLQTYDETKGIALSTYLYICIRNELLKYFHLQENKWNKNIKFSISNTIFENDSHEEIPYENMLQDKAYSYRLEYSINYKQFKEQCLAMSSQSSQKRQVAPKIFFEYVEGTPSAEIQKKYNISTQRLHTIIQTLKERYAPIYNRCFH